MNSENIFKSWFTTLIGAFLLGMSVYDFFFADVLTTKEAVGAFVAGFVLLQMRDKVSGWLEQAITSALKKYFGGKDQTPPTPPTTPQP